MALSIKTLSHQNTSEFDGFYAIYSRAFPLSEQKSRDALVAMQQASCYTIYLAYDDEKIVGFCIMYHPYNEDFFLLEYMAIDEKKRSLGFGSTLLTHSIEQLFATHGTRIILIEIDAPKEASLEQTICTKREEFYRRLGALKIESFEYILPLQLHGKPPPMKLLVYCPTVCTLSKKMLQTWLEKLYMGVYGCSKNDPRITQMLHGVPATLRLI